MRYRFAKNRPGMLRPDTINRGNAIHFKCITAQYSRAQGKYLTLNIIDRKMDDCINS